jgi:hypothetical protein
MSKFTIKVELQSLKIEVEGSKEDVPRMAARVGEQIGELITPTLLLEAHKPSNAATEPSANGSDGKKAKKGKSGAGISKTPPETITVSIDPQKHGSPTQGWTTTQKAVWFLYVVQDVNGATNLTANSIAKNFNKHFKAAGAIHRGNVGQGLEKERLKGTGATVGADFADGAAKYFLTDAGNAMAKQLIKASTTGDAI